MNHIPLGVTGSFGSGCSTLAQALTEVGYRKVSLSQGVRKKWQEIHPDRTTTSRKELQDLGNELRKTNKASFLAEMAVTEALTAGEGQPIVFDGIRNLGEVQFLRERFPNLFLVAVWCSQDERWKRIQKEYAGLQSDFTGDDERDKNEELPYGQQVQLCVDSADIVISNEEFVSSKQRNSARIKE